MSRYLDMIDSPSHLKKLTIEQRIELSNEIRQELITKLSKTGGHLGPNLGVVELTIALHSVFNTPTDKFIWDVSHQSYVHKLLTGRKNLFHTIRTTGGLSGFASRAESEHDCYGAGHAGTAVSAALGIAAARDRLGTNENVVCIVGDAALTNGISYEALNNIITTTKRFILILNDNEFSIAKNVGAIANHLHKLITNPRYNKFQKDFINFLRKFSKGDLAVKLSHKAEVLIKGAVATVALDKQTKKTDDESADGRGGYGSSLIFEELGLRYIGPVDGHDLPLLVSTLEFAKACEEPIVVHVLTQKGHGYDIALKQPEKFHGTGPYDIQTGNSTEVKSATIPTYQDVFGETMVKLCRRDSTIVGITAAMPSGTGLKTLEKAIPERFFDVGIAEEHAALFAAGMATMGFHPVCAIYSTFLQRAFDCILHDIALQNLPVIFCMDRAGLSANDGPTHHGLFDIAYLRCIPNLIGMAPSNEDQFVDMLFTATLQKLPVCIRYPRGSAEGVPIKENPAVLEIGKSRIVKGFNNKGNYRITFISLGNMLKIATQSAMQMESEGNDCAIIDALFFKPIDEGTIEYYARNSDVVVTLEDHVLAGGFGSAVLEFLSEKQIPVPVVRIGWPDKFIEHATTVEDLRQKYGLTSSHTVQLVKETLEQKVYKKATKELAII